MGIMIEGVSLHPLRQIAVPKGDVWHAFKCSDEGFVGFGEAYFTHVDAGAIKGWKRHNRCALNLVVVQGAVRFVLYDDRNGSVTKGQYAEVTLSPSDNYQRLTVAPGLWMAFQGVSKEQAMLIDLIPELHTPDESDKKELDEIRYNW